MKKRRKLTWDGVLHSLILIKIGQDLGTYCPVTKSIHDMIEVITKIF